MSLGSILGGLAANFLFPGSGLLAAGLGSLAGGVIESQLFDDDAPDLTAEKMAKFNAGPDQQEGWDDNLYKSRYTDPTTGEAPAFSSAEERDVHDRNYMVSRAQEQTVEPVYTGMSRGGLAQFAAGGLIRGPGTVTSDSIPGQIMQNGRPVEQIAVGNGEVILSGKDLANMDPDGDMKRAGMRLGGAANGTRGAEAARMFAEAGNMKGRYNG
tara:strand:- start:1074 stop:1709 length:636 start_codon:yes stop_codon:yes gene_type:complete